MTVKAKAEDHNGDWVFTSAPHGEGYVLCMLSVEGYETMARACAPGDEDKALIQLLQKANRT